MTDKRKYMLIKGRKRGGKDERGEVSKMRDKGGERGGDKGESNGRGSKKGGKMNAG